jgi:hypothetical protein
MNLNLPGSWQFGLEIARWFFLVLDAVLLFGAVYFLRKGLKIRPEFTLKHTPRERFMLLKNDASLQMAWEKIKAKAETNPPASYVLTIIEADTFVDDVLKRLGLPGNTMMERLEKLNSQEFSRLEDLRRAHRIRNALVHRPGFTVTREQAVEMMGTYEAFLSELEVV